jgi:hypothetical protein
VTVVSVTVLKSYICRSVAFHGSQRLFKTYHSVSSKRFSISSVSRSLSLLCKNKYMYSAVSARTYEWVGQRWPMQWHRSAIHTLGTW